MTKIMTPETGAPEKFTDAEAAVDRLEQLYVQATEFLCARFSAALNSGAPDARMRAFYPEVRITTTSFARSTRACLMVTSRRPAPMQRRSRAPTCFATT